jgi:Ti-type conjugative transfer relaxase TraA
VVEALEVAAVAGRSDWIQRTELVAIYHLSAKIVHRAKGQSAVAAAAYRSGSSLHEDATGIAHDYTRKRGVEHTEILAPEGAPDWVFDRQTLWNQVESAEKRKDAQLAREIEIGLPVELSQREQIALVRDFARREFVAKGMVADLGVHFDNPQNPHAHILLTTRSLTEAGFGPKNRGWNDKRELLQWRRGWAEVTNEHLAEAGLAVRIDHRSYADQQLGLVPGRKIGLSQERQDAPDLPGFLADRVAEQQRIAGANGREIIAEPTIALKALSRTNATFSHHDLAKFLHTRTDSAAQFQTALLKVTTSAELVPLGLDDAGQQRFTTREMLKLERSLLANADELAQRAQHAVDPRRRTAVLTHHRLSAEQERAVLEVTGRGDLKALAGVAGSGKSTTLAAMREVWEKEGYTVKGAALAGIAAENLEVAAGIQSRTLASYELAWERGRDPLTRRDVLVIDEAGMLGTQQLERVLSVAQKAHAKVVLVGDPEQLQAIEAGAAFRGITAAHGVSHLTEVRRQKAEWQRAATANLATGKTADALNAYDREGGIVAVERREDARTALLARWAHDAKRKPHQSRLVLGYTRDEVSTLNTAIRELRRQCGELGSREQISTATGKRPFAINDRIRFGRNERDLGVKNGSLGTVERIERGVLQVKLDGPSGTRVAVDTKFYKHLDYGYATTVHKAQGTTIDRTYILASRHFDRHTSYVALSRHRDDATLFWDQEEFAGRTGQGGTIDAVKAKRNFEAVLSRARPKELAHDYLEGGWVSPPADDSRRERMAPAQRPAAADERLSVQEQQRRARENWLALKAQDPNRSLTIEEQQARARGRWREYQRSKVADGERSQEMGPEKGQAEERERPSDQGVDDDRGL